MNGVFHVIEVLLLVAILHKAAKLNRKATQIMASQAEDAAKLQAVAGQLDKVSSEITALQVEIQALKDAAASAPVSPELRSAIDAVADRAQKLDDLNPDAAPAPAPPA